VDLFPEVCLGYAYALPRVVDVAACRCQQFELRDHRPHVTEWRRHELVCERCGASTRADFDGTQIPRSTFGPCLTAVVAMLTGAYHLSRRKTRKLLRELFGISVSLGAISAMEQRASEALESAHRVSVGTKIEGHVVEIIEGVDQINRGTLGRDAARPTQKGISSSSWMRNRSRTAS
jgi:transposase